MYSTKNDYVIVWNISSTLNAVLCSILKTTKVINELRVIIKVMCSILTGCKTKFSFKKTCICMCTQVHILQT